MKRRIYTKIAFVFSLGLLILWGILGTGASIAWFVDETPVVQNTFDIGEFDLVVSHKVGDKWVEIDENTAIFDEEALYEPGYTQVVYLKIENKGTRDFNYKLSVNMNSFVPGENAMGQPIYLPNYLKFGAVIEKTEIELQRQLAQKNAVHDMEMLKFNSYSAEQGELAANAGEDSVDYVALIVYMPEEIGNEANYRGNAIPQVDLGITVKASQKEAPIE